MPTNRIDQRSLRRMNLLLTAIYFVSGIPALIFQIAWQRMLALHSGVGADSMASIVASFLLGLGLGSYLGGRFSLNRTAQSCLLGVACLECSIAVLAAISPWVLYELLYQRLGSLYVSPVVTLFLHCLVLILPTTLMGATLPLMTRGLERSGDLAATWVSTIMGWNILGSALGAFLSAWVLMPWFGISGTISIGASMSLFVGLTVLLMLRKNPLVHASVASSKIQRNQREEASQGAGTLLGFIALNFLSGFCAIAMEMIWFRWIDVAVKSTSFTFGSVLAVYLLCLGIGAIVGGMIPRFQGRPHAEFLWLQGTTTALAAISWMVIIYLPDFDLGMGWLKHYWASYDPLYPDQQHWKMSLFLYGVLPFMLLGGPTFCMGLSMSRVQLGVQGEEQEVGLRTGYLQAANIIGCVAGGLSIGLVLFSLGTAFSMRAVMLLSALFSLIGILSTRPRYPYVVQFFLLLSLVFLLPNNLQLWRKTHGSPSEETFMAEEDRTGVAVAIREDLGERWRIAVNGKGQSYLPYQGVHSKLGALPSTLHPSPQSIAIIGLGSGNTAWSASCRTLTQRVQVYEICEPEWSVLKRLSNRLADASLTQLVEDRRIHLAFQDARHSLRTSSDLYDLIEADAIRPNGAFAGNLYSIEFFRLCGSRLHSNGLMCTWSPTRATLSTFCAAFSHVVSVDDGLILIGSNDPIILDKERWRSNLLETSTKRWLGESIVQECLTSIQNATFITSPRDYPWINTDLFPFDEYH